MADAKAPIDVVGTGSFIPDAWHETYATADIVEYDGVPMVKVGREFLLRRNGARKAGRRRLVTAATLTSPVFHPITSAGGAPGRRCAIRFPRSLAGRLGWPISFARRRGATC